MIAVLLLLHAAATWAMIGLIWFVQVVHYPMFALVGRDAFARYAQVHATRTTWVVAPLMLTELATGVLLVAARPGRLSQPALLVGLGLLGVIWLSTAFLSVPRHGELAAGFDATAHGALVATNWIRTWAWTARGALVLWLLARWLGDRPT
jgi:hypothetical protein